MKRELTEHQKAIILSAMKHKGISQTALAKAASIPESTLRSFLNKPNATLTMSTYAAIASVLNIKDSAHVEIISEIPVVGFVGAGDSVDLVDAYAKGDGMDYVPCPPGMDPKKSVAVRVKGDSMEPFICDGWHLYYASRQFGVPIEFINKLCVVKIASSDEVFVKRIMKSAEVGRYNLISYNQNTKPLLNCEIEWSARVAFIKPE